MLPSEKATQDTKTLPQCSPRLEKITNTEVNEFLEALKANKLPHQNTKTSQQCSSSSAKITKTECDEFATAIKSDRLGLPKDNYNAHTEEVSELGSNGSALDTSMGECN